MGQFKQYVERADPPPRLMRVFCLIAPIALIVQAVDSRHLEDILTAAFATVLFLPSGIAPKAYRARLAALDRHLVLSAAFMFLLMLCVLFVLLSEFMSRTTSLYVAAPASAVLTAIAAVRQRTRTRTTR
ncbi:hypothetical protein ACWF0M_08715 [Kribbella sp. NPDC055110]